MFLLYLTLSVSMKVVVDGAMYNGENFSAIIDENSIDETNVTELEILEGSFDMEEFFPEDFEILRVLKIAKDCFNGSIPKSKFENHPNISTISIAGAIEIGDNAFSNCTKLASVSFDSVEIINQSVFMNDMMLTSVSLPKLKTIYPFAFLNCTNLAEIEFSELQNQMTTEDQHIGGYFIGCVNLKKFTAPNIESIETQAFLQCTNLQEVSAPKVTIIKSESFKQTGNIMKIDLSNSKRIEESAFAESLITALNAPLLEYIGGHAFDSSKIKSAEYKNVIEIGISAFNGCNDLVTIDFPNVESIHSLAFADTQIQSMNFPKLTALIDENEVGSHFEGCSKLSSFTAPQLTSIGSKSFYNCANLKTIDCQNIQTIGSLAFQSCKALKKLTFPNVMNISYSAFYLCSFLEEITCAKCKEIDESAFEQCGNLVKISFPQCVKINSAAFKSCIKLKSVTFPAVEYIADQAFQSCKQLTDATFPRADFIGEECFDDCNQLSRVKFHSIKEIPRRAFRQTQLVSMNLPNVTSIDSECFANCSKLQSINLTGLTEIKGDGHFYGCVALASIDLSALTTVDKNSANIFMKCEALADIALGNHPPKTFHSDIFNSSKIRIRIKLPKVDSWKNYVHESEIGKDQEYIWRGIHLGHYKHSTNIIPILIGVGVGLLLLTWVVSLIIKYKLKKNNPQTDQYAEMLTDKELI